MGKFDKTFSSSGAERVTGNIYAGKAGEALTVSDPPMDCTIQLTKKPSDSSLNKKLAEGAKYSIYYSGSTKNYHVKTYHVADITIQYDSTNDTLWGKVTQTYTVTAVTARSTGTPVAGATYELQTYTGDTSNIGKGTMVATFVTQADGCAKITKVSTSTAYDSLAVLSQDTWDWATIDKDGNVSGVANPLLIGIPAGAYQIVETKAAPGCTLNPWTYAYTGFYSVMYNVTDNNGNKQGYRGFRWNYPKWTAGNTTPDSDRNRNYKTATRSADDVSKYSTGIVGALKGNDKYRDIVLCGVDYANNTLVSGATYHAKDPSERYGSLSLTKKVISAIDGTNSKVAGATFDLKDGDTVLATFTSQKSGEALISNVNTTAYPTLKVFKSSTDSSGNTVWSDVSGGGTKLVGIPAGKTYQIVETKAPDGASKNTYVGTLNVASDKQTLTYRELSYDATTKKLALSAVVNVDSTAYATPLSGVQDNTSYYNAVRKAYAANYTGAMFFLSSSTPLYQGTDEFTNINSITLTKDLACDNALISVEGAKYTVYYAGAESNTYNYNYPVGVFEIDSKGTGYVKSVSMVNTGTVSFTPGGTNTTAITNLPDGVYVVRETETPIGCDKSDDITVNFVTHTNDEVAGDYSVTYSKETRTADGVYASNITKGFKAAVGDIEVVIKDPVNIVINKVDSERESVITGEGDGAPSLAGAIFKIEYFHGMTSDQITGDTGVTNTWYVQTKEDSKGNYTAGFNPEHLVSTDVYKSDAAPETIDEDYGYYDLEPGALRITEVAAPEGYLNIDSTNGGYIEIEGDASGNEDSVNSVVFNLDIYGNLITVNAGVEIDSDQVNYYDQVQRGDIYLKKTEVKDSGTLESMKDIVFEIKSESTGEIHYVVTDENGEYDSSKVKHSENTNGNDALFTANAALDSSYGLWFTGEKSGDLTGLTVNDDKGALPYGTYTITELRYSSNKGYILASVQTVTISEDGQKVEVKEGSGDYRDFENFKYPEVKTLSDDYVLTGHNIAITDTVNLKYLYADKVYTIKGIIMDKTTGKAAVDGDGNYITAEKTFTAHIADGDTSVAASKGYVIYETEEMQFTMNTIGMDSDYTNSFVVFEYLYEGESEGAITVGEDGMPVTDGVMLNDSEELICHADINDDTKEQTFKVVQPLADTVLTTTDKGLHTIADYETADVTDVVTYSSLVPGRKYTVVSKLVNGATGEVLTQNGKELVKTQTFTAYKDDAAEVTTEEAATEEATTGTTTESGAVSEGATTEASTESASASPADENSGTSTDNTAADSTSTDNTAASDTTDNTTTDSAATEDVFVGGIRLTDTADAAEPYVYQTGTVSSTFTLDMPVLLAEHEGLRTIVAYQYIYEGDVSDANFIVKHEDLSDADQMLSIVDMHTNAADTAGGNVVKTTEMSTVIDTVSYRGLIPGKEYTVNGVLMCKETGESVKTSAGTEITGSTTFTPEKADGTVDVKFTFDAADCGMLGKTTVVFEDVYTEGKEVYVHADLEDKEQTVYIPKICTTLTETTTGAKEIIDVTEIELTDTVNITNLPEGTKAKVVSELVDKTTGKVIVTGDVTEFTASGTVNSEGVTEDVVTVNFPEFDGFEKGVVSMDGTHHDVVAYEYLYIDTDGSGTYVEKADHADINDADQTVTFKVPTGRTQAEDSESGTQTAYPDKSVTIIDHVSYTNLVVGDEYTLTGTIVRKDTGKALDTKGSKVTVKFTPETSDGTVDVEFTFNASALGGQQIVVFEDCYKNDHEVFIHENLEDEDQTITFPKAGTTATVNGGKYMTKGADNTVVDTIAYEGLDTKETYVIKAELIDKSTKEVVATSKKNFTPDGDERFSDGTTTMNLKFYVTDKGSGSKEYVVFEHIYTKNGTLICEHADLNDEGQTVMVLYSPKTGDTFPVLPVALGFGLAAAVAGLSAGKLRKKKSDK